MMDRTRLLAAALGLVVAFALPAAAHAADDPLFPLSSTPLTLAPGACAADPECAVFVQERDEDLAGETPQQRSARETRTLRFRPSGAITRRVDDVFKTAFDFRTLSSNVSRSLRARLVRAVSPRLLRQDLRKRLAARRWSATDFGDLLALQTIGTWEVANGRRFPAVSANAFRSGLRDLIARSDEISAIPGDQRQFLGELAVLLTVASDRLVAAMPQRHRSGMRATTAPDLLDLVDTEFGIDLRRLQPGPTGFAAR